MAEMDFNFFGWLREGVRRSVLLGVSDAVEEIGMPADADDTPQLFIDSVRQGAKATAKKTTKTTRKRLGKSLKDLD